MVPPQHRGPGPQPLTSFEYRLRNPIPTNLVGSSTGDMNHVLKSNLATTYTRKFTFLYFLLSETRNHAPSFQETTNQVLNSHLLQYHYHILRIFEWLILLENSCIGCLLGCVCIGLLGLVWGETHSLDYIIVILLLESIEQPLFPS
jgi:hypothetical protein